MGDSVLGRPDSIPDGSVEWEGAATLKSRTPGANSALSHEIKHLLPNTPSFQQVMAAFLSITDTAFLVLLASSPATHPSC